MGAASSRSPPSPPRRGPISSMHFGLNHSSIPDVIARPAPPGADASQWWIGLCLELLGSMVTASGKLMWRYAPGSRNPMRFYLIGVFLALILYPIFDTAAYAFTAQQILSALSVLGPPRPQQHLLSSRPARARSGPPPPPPITATPPARTPS